MRKLLIPLIAVALAAMAVLAIPAGAAALPKKDTTPPKVVATSPVSSAVGVPLAQTISVQYNEALQTTPVVSTLTTGSGKSKLAVPVTVSYVASSDTFQFVTGTDNPRTYSTLYILTLQVHDLAGNQSSKLVLKFTTQGAPAVPPPPRYRPVSNDCSAGNVEFTFDDGPGTDTPALLQALQGLGIKAVFFVLGDQIDGNALGTQTVRDEVAQGHIVGNHTYDHLSITGKSTGASHLTDAQLTDELQHTSAVLTSLGLPKPTLYRPPYGDIDAYSDNLARNLGYRIVMPWAIATYHGPRIVDSKDWSGIPSDQIASNVDNGFTDANGFHPGITGGAIISMHDGEADTLPNTIAALQPIVDYMNTNHLCATSTIPADATGGVVALPAPDEPTAGNLVQNPSLETVRAGSTEPTCFQQGGASVASNVATWSLTSDAHSGSVAEQVDVTQWTGGDRKLVLSQRGSQSSCLAPLTAGQSVRVWVWYKGSWAGYGAPSDSTKVSIAVYYRTASGTFNYWTSSPLVPPSTAWSLASVVTPPLPAGATGVSYGMTVQGVGTLVTDDYAMTVQ